MSYKLQYLPVARKDMIDIVQCISLKLSNPDAAYRIADEFVAKAKSLRDMPYTYPVYLPIRPLKQEFRKAVVRNYLMFYWVDEEEKLITVAKVVYVKRNYCCGQAFL